MYLRVLGSAFVVVFGLIPTLIGGPVFVTLMIVLGLLGYREYLSLILRTDRRTVGHAHHVGYAIIVMMGVGGLVTNDAAALFAIMALAVFLPSILQLFAVPPSLNVVGWSLSGIGSLYLGLPVYAAVALRSLPGSGSASWFSSLAIYTSFGWHPAPRGLAWALTVILIVWMGDTMAFLIGRSFGKRKLAPAISPGKTVEGAAGGLIGSMLVGGAAFALFGAAAWPIGLAVGAVIGTVGQLGDLCESMLKRQANVKDSGTLIPGQGGILDRVDALFFAFPASLLIATLLGTRGF